MSFLKKLSLWKDIFNSFPSTLGNIAMRGIDTNPLCLFYRNFVESTSPILWDVVNLRRVFGSIYSLPYLAFWMILGVMEAWWIARLGLFKILRALMEDHNNRCVGIYRILRMTFSSLVSFARIIKRGLLKSIALHVEEFFEFYRCMSSLSRKKSQSSHESWTPPFHGLSKLNSDASWCDCEEAGRISWMVHDSSTSLVLASCDWMHFWWLIKFLEALMVVKSLTTFIDCFAFVSHTSIPVESDCNEFY